jgi:hypothetical protein
MHMSVLNTKTSSSGATLPIRSSVQAKLSKTGTPKASLITERIYGSSVSLVELTCAEAIRSRPTRASSTGRANIEA